MALLAYSSCTPKHIDPAADYMIVFSAGGIFGGTHRPYYVLTTSSLIADTTHDRLLPPVTLSGLNLNYVQPQAKFDQVKSLLTAIPAELLANNNKEFGTMPGNDMYSVAVQAHINGKDYSWGFQLDQTGSSAPVVQFYNRVVLFF